MDRYNDNKATPTKRTGVKNDNDDKNKITSITPEITQPNPSSATPTIPSEMPAREIK
ncbi:MAG: hypothetical protein GX379_07970 [Clostridiales bacterium]|jgi:hypothetical protein|nr:hypothetical protein [Clostridiales bacterium]